MPPDTNAFDAYEEELQLLTNQVQRQLGSQGNALDVTSMTCLLAQCESIIKQMSIDLRFSDDSELEAQRSRLDLYKIQLQSLKHHVNSHDLSKKHGLSDDNRLVAASSETKQLSGAGGIRPVSDVLSTRLRLSQQNANLERARRTIADTEDTAAVIAEELRRHRSTIEQSHEKVFELSELTNDASRILSRMNKRWF